MSQAQPKITIIGAGLTGLTTGFYLKNAGFNVTILERTNHIGGVIQSVKKNGFLYEKGPNTGVVGNVELVTLFKDLEGIIEPIIANPDSKKRLILKNKHWHALPSGVLSAIKTPLFTWYDKFRILGEPFRKKGTNPDETLADLVRRRMGNSFLKYAIDPFISGIYAGDPETLIPRLALPKLYNLEQNYGSFIKGAIKKAKEPKTDLEKQVSKEVFSIKGGLQKLTDALAHKIGGENILLNIDITQIEKVGNQFSIKYNISDKIEQLKSDIVISTIGANEFTKFCPFINQNQIQILTNIRYAKITQVAVGYNEWKGIPINAFGGLVPSSEKRNVLGVLFPSSIFKNRAPEGGALLSFFMGGIKKPELFDLNDEEVLAIVTNELKELLNTDQKPDFVDIFRYPMAIPQYEISSDKRFKVIDEIQNDFNGLILAGNIRNGIGMSDRVKQGYDIAQSIINQHH